MEIRIFTYLNGEDIDECAFDDSCLIPSVTGKHAVELAEEFDLSNDGDYAEVDISDCYLLTPYGIDANDIDGDVYIYLSN